LLDELERNSFLAWTSRDKETKTNDCPREEVDLKDTIAF